MQTDSQIPYHLVRWYWQLMTGEERRAQQDLMGTMKHGRRFLTVKPPFVTNRTQSYDSKQNINFAIWS